ncbi:aaa atpase [Moniliophthora roreri MCA 2997]|uniref:Aaa atpase n=1 Tax=Moniliophthora roreri (strain MCA 2997) TaxID=1381753 RepID=V2XWX4_MONRO|nr:aaa atpase [Moniliophthora roreri MCA 2997]
MSGKGSLSATNLASYHHFNCQLYLHNVYHGAEGFNGDSPRESIALETSELSKAQQRRGLDWEGTLLSYLDEQNMLLTVPSIPMTGKDLMENLAFDDREHIFVAGLSFWPPQEDLDALYREVGQKPVKFGLSKPDLLEITRIEGGVLWRIVDAKASRAVKTSHHVQIYFYTLCLQYLLPKPFFEPASTAAVWLPPVDGFDATLPSLEDLKPVDISLLSHPLDGFLLRRLPQVLDLPKDAVPWHFNPACQGCPYTSPCKNRSIEDGELGSMSNISFGQAKVLRSLLSMWRRSGTYVTGGRTNDIEDLSQLFKRGDCVQSLTNSNPITMRKAKRILSLPTRVRSSSRPLRSPVIEAARSRDVQMVPKRNYSCPRIEDIAVVLSLIQDPSAPILSIVSFSISIFYNLPFLKLPNHLHGTGMELIRSLGNLIRAIQLETTNSNMPISTQFYVFSSGEHSVIQTHLISAALEATENIEDVRICIGALAQGASLLQTTFQPMLLSGVLLEFVASKQRQKSELVDCLERMNLPIDGTVDELRNRILNELRKYQSHDQVHSNEERRGEFAQLPRIVVLKTELERSLALPIPGFWDLPDCASILVSPSCLELCPSDEELYKKFRDGESLELSLQQRNEVIYSVLEAFRRRLRDSEANLLVNDAKPISSHLMDLCRDEKLRKLFFMQQFEVLAKLSELWKARIEGCPEAPVLQYRTTRQGPKGSLEHIFHLESGVLDMPNSDKELSFFGYLLVEDDKDDDFSELPTEALFDDLGLSGIIFPLNRYTKEKWLSQHPDVQNHLFVAGVRDMSLDGENTQVSIQTWGGADIQFVLGKRYRLSPRLVDFNTAKILSTLFELDLRCSTGEPVPFLQLVLDPNLFRRESRSAQSEEFLKALRRAGVKIQSLFQQLKGLDVESAGPLLLKASQDRAAQHVLMNRLSVIWGPPGTGKTHTIALSLLRLLNVQYSLGDKGSKIVFITAMTHAAIEAILSKLAYLTDCYRSIESLPLDWLDQVKVEHVLKGNDHQHPRTLMKSSALLVYAGTVYQLYTFSKKQSVQADVLMIDEAGQLALSASSLVLRALSPTGKVIIAGDQEQLSPILAAQYPQLKTGPLFGSILDCLVHFSERIQRSARDGPPSSADSDSFDEIPSTQGSVVQLTENFRLNPDLGEFISTIYSRAFVAQNFQPRQLANSLRFISNGTGENFGLANGVVERVRTFLLALSNVMLKQHQSFLSQPPVAYNPKDITYIDEAFRPISLTLLRLGTRTRLDEEVSYEMHVKAEAMLAAALVCSLQRCSPDENIFVATPHRVQRNAVRAMLQKTREAQSTDKVFGKLQLGRKGKVTVDTVERLQGSEAAFVICLFSLSSSEPADLKFLLERRRLNVAISRAKMLCILISSSEVLRPSVDILADEGSAKGYAFLKAYEDRAWSAEITVDMDQL